MMDHGWVKSYRSKWTHPAFRNLLEAAMWAWLCETAFWERRRVRFNGQLITLERGQLATSVRFISKGFNIGEQVTRTFLENLQKEKMITLQPTHWGSIITICNYNKFQSFEDTPNTLDNADLAHNQLTHHTNNKEVNNLKSKKEKKDIGVSTPKAPKGISFQNWFDEIKKLDPGVDGEHCPDLLYEEAERMGFAHIAIQQWSLFHDYWVAQTGQKAIKADWIATWRNWLRRDFGNGKG